MPPPRGRLKLNLDGASEGNPGAARCGGVIRDFQGSFLYGFSVSIGTNTYAEISALIGK